MSTKNTWTSLNNLWMQRQYIQVPIKSVHSCRQTFSCEATQQMTNYVGLTIPVDVHLKLFWLHVLKAAGESSTTTDQNISMKEK